MSAFTVAAVGAKITAALYNAIINKLTVWTAYTPTFTNWSSTDPTTSARWSRIGDSCTIILDSTLGSSPTVAGIRFSIPSSLTIDTTGLTASQSTFPGSVTIYDSSTTTVFAGICVYYDSGTLAILKNTTAANPGVWTQPTTTSPMTWAVSDEIHVAVTFPII